MSAVQALLGQSNKKHSNRSKNSKNGKKGKKGPETSGKRKNPKAFNVSNVVSAKKNAQRNLDKAQQKEVVPLVNREEAIPPPSLVVVMGPKSCGKTTLIRSLVKIYTGQNMTDTTGPVTVIAGNKKRFTFFECPLDLYSMTDLAKVPDLVLLMIDASYGLEMETFEYLNLLQLHGFPKVIGVLTHLDRFRSVKSLQNTKKEIKHRFWTEIYKGAKLFDFMGVVNGKYRKHEVKRLSLHINRVKFRPLIWHNTHPYVLVDRVEDVTPVTSKKSKRKGLLYDQEDEDTENHGEETGEKEVTLYGYVRGCHLKSSTKIHLVGAGDFDMSSITALPDPCPVKSSDPSQTALKQSRKKDHLLYAPMANVGRVSMDKDSLYIDLKHIHYTKKDQIYLPDQQQTETTDEASQFEKGTPMDLLRSMQEVKVGVDQQLKRSRGELSLFANSSPMIVSDDEAGSDLDEYDQEDSENDENDENDEGDEEGDNDSEEADEEDQIDDEMDQEEDDDYDDDERDDDQEDEDEDEDEDGENAENNEHSSRRAEVSNRLNSTMMMKQLLSSSSDRFNDVMKVVYGQSWAQSGAAKGAEAIDVGGAKSEEEGEDEFFTVRNKSSGKDKAWTSDINRIDSSRFFARHSTSSTSSPSFSLKSAPEAVNSGLMGNWNSLRLSISEICRRNSRSHSKLKSRFVTGGYSKPITARKSTGESSEEEGSDDQIGDSEEDEEVDGDFVDLEAMENGESLKSSHRKTRNSTDEEEDDEEEEEEQDSGIDSEEEQERMNEAIDQQLRTLNAQKKSLFKQKFDQNYDREKSGEGSDDGADTAKSAEETSLDGEGKTGKDGRRKHRKGGDVEEEDEINLIEKAQRDFELQSQRNLKEFGDEGELARHRYEGFRQGLYVRIHLKGVPREFLENFSSQRPVVVGGLLPSETAMGFITARVKRHRWHKKILKSNDPLIFSIGWRRFQSIPIYTTTDQNERERYLKYTPQHMHCTSTFYGPLIAPNTGVLAYQTLDSRHAGFRIALTGTALEQRATPQVVKKLKLTGTPVKIFKNTAFITGMFNSALEVAKFEHAKIKTVSGIRGSIKKAVNAKNDVKGLSSDQAQQLGRLPPGAFRATFEDKILLSDIVICRVWVNVEPKKFYNPIMSLLSGVASSEAKESDDGEAAKPATDPSLMRSTAQLRKDLQIAQVVKKDSVYKPVVRQTREFSKLHIPAKLQESLPFASKPKQQKAKNPQSYLARRAVILEPEERKQRGLIQMLSTIRKDKETKRKSANKARLEQKQKQMQKEKEKFEDVHREEKKRKYKEMGLERQRKMQKVQ